MKKVGRFGKEMLFYDSLIMLSNLSSKVVLWLYWTSIEDWLGAKASSYVLRIVLPL